MTITIITPNKIFPLLSSFNSAAGDDSYPAI